MTHRPRIYYTETDKALMWDRWQKGESLQSIAHHFDRTHGSIAGILARTGGIPAGQKAVQAGSDVARTRRDLTWCDRRPFCSIDRGIAGSIAFHSEPRD